MHAEWRLLATVLGKYDCLCYTEWQLIVYEGSKPMQQYSDIISFAEAPLVTWMIRVASIT